MKDSYLFLAEGFEEVEALTAVDLLRRAGIPVKTVSITSALQVKGAHGIMVTADLIFDNTLFTDAPWLILPGGMPGASNLYEFAPLNGVLINQKNSKSGRIAAICAAPAVVLAQLGLLKEVDATCYPGFEEMLAAGEANVKKDPVVVSGKFVTGNGPANAMPWALRIIAETLGEDKANQVANGLLLYPRSRKDIDHYFG